MCLRKRTSRYQLSPYVVFQTCGKLYCSMAMHVRITPIARFKCIDSCCIAACKTATKIMLEADTKHFAKLSKYFRMNETSKPHAVRDTTVAHAYWLNPCSRVRLSEMRDKEGSTPKQKPKK